ncbi:MAG: DNA-3-methyladenine glycosylase I [Planctomycetota bacterium]
MEMQRCEWAKGEKYEQYHDEEWGVPSRDERHLFEMLILEGAQAGLSWITILNKREHYRKVYDNFEVKKVARYTEAKQQKLLADPGIVRNRLKVAASVQNAKAFLEVQKEFGSFAEYVWAFVDHTPIQNRFKTLSDVPAKTDISDALSKDLKKRGFKFVGSTIMYAFMQSVGMVNDHMIYCPRHQDCAKLAKVFYRRSPQMTGQAFVSKALFM